MLFDNKDLSEIGKTVKTNGLNGHISIDLYDNYSESIFTKETPVFLIIDGTPVPFFIENIKNTGNYIAVKFRHIDSEPTASKFINCSVSVFTQDIPDDEEDDFENILINYKVYDAKYGYIGIITDFDDIPGNPIFQTDFNGKNIIIPLSDQFVTGIDKDKKELYISAPDGLIDVYLEQ